MTSFCGGGSSTFFAVVLASSRGGEEWFITIYFVCEIRSSGRHRFDRLRSENDFLVCSVELDFATYGIQAKNWRNTRSLIVSCVFVFAMRRARVREGGGGYTVLRNTCGVVHGASLR